MRELTIVAVPAGKKPYVTTIKNDLKTMQKFVGGFIEVIYLQDNLLLICDEEGKINGKTGNRILHGDIIAGDFFIVGDNEHGEFQDLTDKQISEVIERFLEPEAYSDEEVQESIKFTFIPL